MADVAGLREQAERFAPLTEPVEEPGLVGFRQRLTALDPDGRIEEVVAALDAGRPLAAWTLIDEIAGRLQDAEPEASMRPLIYWSAVAARLDRDDLEQLMATTEEHLGGPRPPDPELWDQTSRGHALSEALAGRLVPLAGLDVEAALEYTRIYVANFPQFSRPMGDLDQRATVWIAQILDLGSTRRTHRRILRRVAQTWPSRYPRAADQARRLADGPPPDDPTQDQPWVRGLMTLARTQI